ncbi:MAG: 3-deoxy-D-manno-octulosonic acid transferase, partial [Phycisphaerae bacterium]
LAWVGAQDESIARRFVELGVPANRVEVAGSLKWDTTIVADSIDGAEALSAALGLSSTTPLWVCGSTGPDEEKLLLEAYGQLLQQGQNVALAIVPRKPERFNQVADLIRSRGFKCVRRSERPHGATNDSASSNDDSRPAVILGDTMGELRQFYCLATAVFVGRSLVPMGGSDPMEVAALAKPIIAGPHMNNFALPVAALAKVGALHQVRGVADLAATVAELLINPDTARQQGLQARQVVLQNQGATDRTIERLVGLIDKG